MNQLNYDLVHDVINSVIPSLSASNHKGQCGRIGIIGGCKEFTGAPYFAAISSLKLGSDLVYVFCTSSAAGPIKSYSPELIVQPILDNDSAVTLILPHLSKLHALIIGPGLGRDDSLTETILSIICKARELKLPLLLDADSLYFIGKKVEVIDGYWKAILTPNAIEFMRLHKILFGREMSDEEKSNPNERVKEMCNKLGNLTIVRKGPQDIISDGKSVAICAEQGSFRRCGGQGDLLVGSMATFSHWCHSSVKLSGSPIQTNQFNPCVVAAFAACLFTRKCNRLAFDRLGRTMTTTDMISEISNTFVSLFPKKFHS